MQILIINNKDISYYPPVKNLVDILIDLDHSITLITYDKYGYEYEKRKCDKLKCINIYRFRKNISQNKFICTFLWKKLFRKHIKKELIKYDVIWTTTDTTISLVGKLLLNQNNHIMQLMELVEDAPILPYEIIYKLKLNNVLKINLKRFANNALGVVVPEYNRAQILKGMWNLENTPFVLPNKPYNVKVDTPSLEILDLVESIKKVNKKIILYQGIFRKERKLEEFAQAVEELGEDYILCVMGNDSPERRELCELYPNIMYIPFITPPYHLLITQHAHIGILTYFPTAKKLVSKLNVIYCAPNKIYEYAYCGLPMIGNDIPGLTAPFEKYNIGVCFKEMCSKDIVKAILKVENEYINMKKNCKIFYEDIDMKDKVNEILNMNGG